MHRQKLLQPSRSAMEKVAGLLALIFTIQKPDLSLAPNDCVSRPHSRVSPALPSRLGTRRSGRHNSSGASGAADGFWTDTVGTRSLSLTPHCMNGPVPSPHLTCWESCPWLLLCTAQSFPITYFPTWVSFGWVLAPRPLLKKPPLSPPAPGNSRRQRRRPTVGERYSAL